MYDWNKAEWQAFLTWLVEVRSDNHCLGMLKGLEELYNEYLEEVDELIVLLEDQAPESSA